MGDAEYIEPRLWTGKIVTAVIVLFIILVICLNDSCRDRLHRIYNFIPPQKAKLTISLQSSPDDFLSNQPLIFDGKDSLTADNEGEVVIDDLPVGNHSYSIMYGDSLHQYTLNLKKDSLITVTLHMQGNDVVKGGGQPTGERGDVEVKSQKGKVTLYGSQWFTVGNTVRFGPICVKLVKLDNSANNVYVNICHTANNFTCQNTIVDNNELSRDNWIRFTDGGYNYRLVLDRIDNTPQDTKNLAAFVSLTQTVR
jgi:hypothetical protein